MRIFVIFITLISSMQMTNAAFAKQLNPIIAVIVSSKQNIDELKLSTKNLNLIYWRKQQFWPKGLRIKPVNLSSKHSLRIAFSKATLGSTPTAQLDYWNGQYFNGILPPYSVQSEEAVLRYVAQTKGAIGYIDACQLDERVAPILWIIHSKLTATEPQQLNCK
jgi:ABC-type phosphate transport system substrate-binding protein